MYRASVSSAARRIASVVASVTLNRSEVATPATQAISPRRLDDRHVRRVRVAARVELDEQVLQRTSCRRRARAAPSGRPARHERTSSSEDPSAPRSSTPGSRTPAFRDLAAHVTPAEHRHSRESASTHRRRRGRRWTSLRVEPLDPQPAVLRDRPQPGPDVEHRGAPLAQRGQLVGPARRARARIRRPPRRRGAGRRAGATAAGRPRSASTRNPAARARPVDQRVEHLGLVAQGLAQRQHVRLRPPGWSARSAGTRPLRMRLRAYASDALLVVLAPAPARGPGSTRPSPRA